MNFLKKIFKSKQPQTPPQKKKPKASFLTWLCATKPQNQHQKPLQRGMDTISQQFSGKKSSISVAQTNNTKIIQRLSFIHNDKSQYAQQQIRSMLITLEELKLQKIESIIQQNGMYGMINSQQPLIEGQLDCIWMKIGRNEQINSLCHLRPYSFDKIFMIFDEFGSQYSIEQILKCKQNVLLKLSNKKNIQSIIETYQKELIKHYAFKIIGECFNKLKITIIKTKRNQIWLNFNQQIQSDTLVIEILNQIGFDQNYQQYQSLKQEIPTGLTLQQYIDIIEHKQKLESKYQGQSVGQYIKNKFLQKISKKGKSPRNDSPRQAQRNQNVKDQDQQQYEEYIMSMTANTLPKNHNQLNDSKISTNKANSKEQKQSFEQEIFDFNVYKDEKQQQAKRVAINRQRKKRSKSQDISLNDLDKGYQYGDQFDEKQ